MSKKNKASAQNVNTNKKKKKRFSFSDLVYNDKYLILPTAASNRLTLNTFRLAGIITVMYIGVILRH